MPPSHSATPWIRGLFAVVLALSVGTPAHAQGLYKADLMIRSLEVTRVAEGVEARAVIAMDDAPEVRGTSVQFLLPVGVGVVRVAAGCALGASPPGVSAVRARVVCEVGTLHRRESRDLFVITTDPPPGMKPTFGVVALSDTPDPKPNNNFAERSIH